MGREAALKKVYAIEKNMKLWGLRTEMNMQWYIGVRGSGGETPHMLALVMLSFSCSDFPP